MLCQNCQKNTATTFFKQTVNGKTATMHLCSECIKNFYEQVVPMISRIHGNAEHTGKIPKSAGPKIRLKSRIGELKGKLDAAITAQEFEEAAKLRDEIKNLEGQVNNGE